jgi:phosphoglycolate phosphatase
VSQVSPAQPLRAVLFDLDGTLLDTAEDIALALNRALAEQQLPGLSTAVVRLMIGRGVPTLIQRALTRLGTAADSADAPRLLERFHFHYQRLAELGDIHTRVYPGVTAGFAALKAMPVGIAVVTNKPQAAARDLLDRFRLSPWIDVVIGGDSGLPQKPHPDPLLRACETLKVPAAQALMVGDSQTDVLAARAAGMPVVCVPYGYNEGNDPRELPCDAFIENVGELPALLTQSGGRIGSRAALHGRER